MKGNLLETPKVKDVIQTWKNLSRAEEVAKWLMEELKKENGLIKVVDLSISRKFSLLATNVLPDIKYEPNFRWLEQFIPKNKIINEIKAFIKKNNSPEEHKREITSILEEYLVKSDD